MRKITLIIFLFISFFLLSESPVDAARGISVIGDLNHQSGKLGTYRALIIGINDYKDPKIPDLETAVNDASAMAELLKGRYGFKVELLLNRKATRKAIYIALRNLASSTKPSDSVLIYYAGHGDLDRTYNDGWWIPVDAEGGDPVTYFENVQVQKAMRSMKARHALLISDSCYSGTLFGQARAMPPIKGNKYYLNLYNEKSRWGMTSGNKTPVSDTGSGGHSVFAYQLLKELRQNEKPYISTQEIYTRIAPIVGNNSEQTPICRPIRNTGDQGGEFVFVSTGGSTTKAPAFVDTGLDKERKRLEQERREVERIKAEIEEIKRLESERKRIEVEKKKLLAQKAQNYASISPATTSSLGPGLGIRVAELTPEMARKYKAKEGEGVIVAGVESGSQAETKGLLVGDWIKEVNHQPIKSVKDFNKTIDVVKEGETVNIFARRPNRGFLVIKITKNYK